MPGRGLGPAGVHRRRAGARRRRRSTTAAPIRAAIRGRRCSASSRRAKPGATPGCAPAEPRRRRDHRQRRRRHRRRRDAVPRTSSPPAGEHVTPYAIAVGICGMVSSEISISLGLRGMSHVLSCGCTSSTDAIGYAAALIRAGEYDVVLSGGTDGCVLPGMMFGFSRMRAVSTHYNDRPAAASRPFDRGRDGFVLGEGAWMMVLEREDRAHCARRHPVRTHRGLCVHLRRLPSRPDGSRRRRDRALHRDGAGQGGPPSGGDRLHQLPRHVDAVERRRSSRAACGGCSARTPTRSRVRRPSR